MIFGCFDRLAQNILQIHHQQQADQSPLRMYCYTVHVQRLKSISLDCTAAGCIAVQPLLLIYPFFIFANLLRTSIPCFQGYQWREYSDTCILKKQIEIRLPRLSQYRINILINPFYKLRSFGHQAF